MLFVADQELQEVDVSSRVRCWNHNLVILQLAINGKIFVGFFPKNVAFFFYTITIIVDISLLWELDMG